MKPALYTILFILMMPAIVSCKKKKVVAPVEVSTDSLYLQAVVDSFTFTAATTTGVYSGQSSYWVSTKAYLQIVARTGPDSTDGTISIRLDNWPHQTGDYIISSLYPNNKASYAKTDKKVETADSGRVTITEIGKAVKGRFYFYTKNHQVSSGYFSAQ
jgi:hypothetical protein